MEKISPVKWQGMDPGVFMAKSEIFKIFLVDNEENDSWIDDDEVWSVSITLYPIKDNGFTRVIYEKWGKIDEEEAKRRALKLVASIYKEEAKRWNSYAEHVEATI